MDAVEPLGVASRKRSSTRSAFASAQLGSSTRELLTADARERVARAQVSLPGHGAGAQQAIAGGMPVVVVEALEVVEVDHRHAQRSLGAHGGGQHLVPGTPLGREVSGSRRA